MMLAALKVLYILLTIGSANVIFTEATGIDNPTDVDGITNKLQATHLNEHSIQEGGTHCSFGGRNEAEEHSNCEWTLIGWHGTDNRYIKSIEGGLNPLALNLKQYERKIGPGFYISNSASEVVKTYATPGNPALCGLYVPTELFKRWIKIYIPSAFEVTFPPSKEYPQFHRKRVSIHYSYATLRVYLRALEMMNKIPNLVQDPFPLFVTKLNVNGQIALQMSIPPEKFRYVRARCMIPRYRESVRYLDLDWWSIIKRQSDNDGWKVHNAVNPVFSVDKEVLEKMRNSDRRFKFRRKIK
ncbi:hypothetical protein BKA69DRAFT_1127037 [Paraphysoderma sedebokerense]|nr:hypothetical protein BKA69DRAFT_1127037 [Paraphysoderma sedebokerense]